MQCLRITGGMLALLLLAAPTCSGQQWAGATDPPPVASEPSTVPGKVSAQRLQADPELLERLRQISRNQNPATKPKQPPLPVRTESRNLKPVPQSAPPAVSHRIGITQATYSPSQPVETEQQIKQVSAAEAESSESSAPAFLDLDNSEATQAGTEAAPQTDMDMILRLATWTIIILCLCVLTVLGLRSWQKKHGMLPVTQGNSRVLETVSIGPNRSVCLVQLRDIQAVVGCDASGIQSIVLAPPSFDTALAETDEPAEVFETTI